MRTFWEKRRAIIALAVFGSVALGIIHLAGRREAVGETPVKDDFLVRDGQTVLFLGDSITAADPGYTRLIAALIAARHPGRKIDYVYAGVSGNNVNDLLARLDKDVIAKKPDWVTISIGVNDVWHAFMPKIKDHAVPLETFVVKYDELLDRIQKETKAQVVCLTPTVIHEDLGAEENRILEGYVEATRKAAAKHACRFVDLRAAFRKALAEWKGPRDEKGNALTTDGVHMNPAGNALMAIEILKVLGFGL